MTMKKSAQKSKSIEQSSQPDIVAIDKKRLAQRLARAQAQTNLESLRARIADIKAMVENHSGDEDNVSNAIVLRRDVLLGELDQIAQSQTLERARYYLKRLASGIGKTKTSKLNDINLLRWKEYDHIITDSLWVMRKRDSSGVHLAEYWGNFIPQIPHQMMLRYTKRNDWVLDTFAGSGTTLIEGRRLGRNCIGIELNARVAERAGELVTQEQNRFDVTTEIVVGDNRTVDYKSVLAMHQIDRVQLVLMHPPYHDIIQFSKDARDLSNAKTTQAFLDMFGETVDNVTPFLEKRRFLALVIGDKYSKGDWIPLGFLCMQEVLKRDYQLKAIIVKNFEETRGKRSQQELWRYRALVGGFYVFKHEYVIVFKKK